MYASDETLPPPCHKLSRRTDPSPVPKRDIIIEWPRILLVIYCAWERCSVVLWFVGFMISGLNDENWVVIDELSYIGIAYT
jgi:hypothetical protein